MDDIRAVAVSNASAVNPAITIGNSKITFNTTLNSGEYIEYYPEEGKAYQNYYSGNCLMVKEISFSGSVEVPNGAFTYTYSATPANSNIPLRAKVTIGTEGAVIANESTWTAPEVEIPDGWDKIQLH